MAKLRTEMVFDSEKLNTSIIFAFKSVTKQVSRLIHQPRRPRSFPITGTLQRLAEYLRLPSWIYTWSTIKHWTCVNPLISHLKCLASRWNVPVFPMLTLMSMSSESFRFNEIFPHPLFITTSASRMHRGKWPCQDG